MVRTDQVRLGGTRLDGTAQLTSRSPQQSPEIGTATVGATGERLRRTEQARHGVLSELTKSLNQAFRAHEFDGSEYELSLREKVVQAATQTLQGAERFSAAAVRRQLRAELYALPQELQHDIAMALITAESGYLSLEQKIRAAEQTRLRNAQRAPELTPNNALADALTEAERIIVIGKGNSRLGTAGFRDWETFLSFSRSERPQHTGRDTSESYLHTMFATVYGDIQATPAEKALSFNRGLVLLATEPAKRVQNDLERGLFAVGRKLWNVPGCRGIAQRLSAAYSPDSATHQTVQITMTFPKGVADAGPAFRQNDTRFFGVVMNLVVPNESANALIRTFSARRGGASALLGMLNNREAYEAPIRDFVLRLQEAVFDPLAGARETQVREKQRGGWDDLGNEARAKAAAMFDCYNAKTAEAVQRVVSQHLNQERSALLAAQRQR